MRAPTPNFQLQLPRHSQRPTPKRVDGAASPVGRWELGVPWRLGVGSWELTSRTPTRDLATMRRNRRDGGDVVPALRGRHPRHLHGADRARPRRPRPRRPCRAAVAPEARSPARGRRRHAPPVPLRAASVAERLRLRGGPQGRRRAEVDGVGIGAARPAGRHRGDAPAGAAGRRDDRARPLGRPRWRDGGTRGRRPAARRQPARLRRVRRRAPRRRRRRWRAGPSPAPAGSPPAAPISAIEPSGSAPTPPGRR